jgi:rhodanese-related sulfurtransferase
LDQIAEYTAAIWKLVLLGAGGALGILIALRLVRWYRFLGKFKLARITPEELRDKLGAGARILVLDLQGDLSSGQSQPAIPGAVRLDPHQICQYLKRYRDVDLGTDREVILYCASPGEAISARVALALRQRGFDNVRPLAGGLRSWLDHGFPVTTDVSMLPAPEHAAFVLREVLQYSRLNAARVLKTSAANVDHLLESALRRIENTAPAQHVAHRTDW